LNFVKSKHKTVKLEFLLKHFLNLMSCCLNRFAIGTFVQAVGDTLFFKKIVFKVIFISFARLETGGHLLL